MKRMFNQKLKTIIVSSIVLDIILIIFGLFLVCNPLLVTTVANVIIGVLLIVSGLYSIMKYLLNDKRNIIFTGILAYGLLAVIFGGIIMINPLLLANIITVIIGIWAILSGVIKLSIAIRFKKYHEESWVINSIIAFLIILTGLLLVINPFSGTISISVYVGVSIIVYSGLDIVEKMIFNKRIKEISEIISI